jgi:hypothetical protein
MAKNLRVEADALPLGGRRRNRHPGGDRTIDDTLLDNMFEMGVDEIPWRHGHQ